MTGLFYFKQVARAMRFGFATAGRELAGPNN